MTKVGEHITLDIIGTTKEYDPSLYEKVIHDIAKAAKVTILNISKYKFEPQGFTILALLAESHISFHTFPEKGIISFDFFTCGKVNPSVAIDIIKKNFEHKRIVKKEFNRDTKSLYHDIYSSPGLQKSYVVNDVLEDFKCFKYISDNADDDASSDWIENCKKGAKLFQIKMSEF